jgi:hypothetical protein
MVLCRYERHGRCGHDIGDSGQLVRRCLGFGDERGDDVGGPRQDQHAADKRVDWVQPVLEPGGHAEVATAASERPEQVRMRLGVHSEKLAVRGHDIGGQQ